MKTTFINYLDFEDIFSSHIVKAVDEHLFNQVLKSETISYHRNSFERHDNH